MDKYAELGIATDSWSDAQEMKASQDSLRTGEYVQFDNDFKVELDSLINQTYEAFEKSVSFLGPAIH